MEMMEHIENADVLYQLEEKMILWGVLMVQIKNDVC
jgi:hypothetical protein